MTTSLGRDTENGNIISSNLFTFFDHCGDCGIPFTEDMQVWHYDEPNDIGDDCHEVCKECARKRGFPVYGDD